MIRQKLLTQVGWITAEVVEADGKESLLTSLSENMREEPSPIDEAKSFRRLEKAFGMKAQEIADLTGKDDKVVRERLKLLKLPLDVQDKVHLGKLSQKLLSFNDVVDTNSTAYAVGELIGSIHEALMIVASMGSLRNCFPAGTPVSTVDGLRPIETIKHGDKVWAYDLTASEWRPCRVMQTFCTRYRGRSVLVTVAGETIEATFRHPFFVVRGKDLDSRPRMEHLAEVPANATTPGRWVDAGDLCVGDELLLLDGRALPVTALQVRRYDANVYNFEVDNLHCYVVGRCGALVHNNNGFEALQQQRLANAKTYLEFLKRCVERAEGAHQLAKALRFAMDIENLKREIAVLEAIVRALK